MFELWLKSSGKLNRPLGYLRDNDTSWGAFYFKYRYIVSYACLLLSLYPFKKMATTSIVSKFVFTHLKKSLPDTIIKFNIYQ